MLFDLEPYIPFNVFATVWLIGMCALVAWGAERDNRKNKDK